MNESPRIAASQPHWGWRMLAWAAVSVAFTACAIQFSFQHGRLIAVPGCDDVNYFCDGLDRLEAFYLRGWSGLIDSCRERPPHSPFSSALAAGSFALFGVHEWAPYAGNAVLVFALIAFTEWLLRGARLWLRVVGVVLVLATPLSRVAVIEFRPDVAVAIVTAIGVVLALMRSLTTASPRYRLAVGAAFGLAFLVKPSMAVLTFGLCGLSLSLSALCNWYLERSPLRQLLRCYGIIVLVLAVIAGPWFAWNGWSIARYIYTNIFGADAATWQLEMSAHRHVLYYLNGPGAVQMLDNWAWVLFPTVGLGLACALARRRREELVRAVALATCTLAAYAVPTISKCKHGFYGLDFFLLVVLAAVLSLRHLALIGPRWRSAVFVVLIGCALFALSQPPRALNWGARNDGWHGSTRKTCGDIVSALVAHRPEGEAVVFPTAECRDANAVTLKWLTKMDGHKFRFSSLPKGSGLDQYRRAMDVANLVLAIESKTPDVRFASERQADAILAMLRARPHFAEVQSFPSYGGVVYHLFKNKYPLFWGWSNAAGLGPIEGPFPHLSLPQVRWGLGRQTDLLLSQTTGGPLLLSLSCWTDVEGQTLTVLLDGREVHTQAVPVGRWLTGVDVELPVLATGEHTLTLRYAGCAGDGRQLAVLFERLQVLPGRNNR